MATVTINRISLTCYRAFILQCCCALNCASATRPRGIMELSFPRTFAPKSESTIGGTFAPWYFRSLELSLPGTFVPWNFRSLELSLPGAKVTWNFRSLELSPLYQYEKRITVALSTKECSLLPTNVALQSVLTYRHVRRTYDAG